VSALLDERLQRESAASICMRPEKRGVDGQPGGRRNR
jgi:hypothetical protein